MHAQLLAKNNWDCIAQEILISTPRRFGKTISERARCAALPLRRAAAAPRCRCAALTLRRADAAQA